MTEMKRSNGQAAVQAINDIKVGCSSFMSCVAIFGHTLSGMYWRNQSVR